MCKKEVAELDAMLTAFEKKIHGNKKESEDFLLSIGVITKSGNLTKPYKNLCTQPGRV